MCSGFDYDPWTWLDDAITSRFVKMCVSECIYNIPMVFDGHMVTTWRIYCIVHECSHEAKLVIWPTSSNELWAFIGQHQVSRCQKLGWGSARMIAFFWAYVRSGMLTQRRSTGASSVPTLDSTDTRDGSLLNYFCWVDTQHCWGKYWVWSHVEEPTELVVVHKEISVRTKVPNTVPTHHYLEPDCWCNNDGSRSILSCSAGPEC